MEKDDNFAYRVLIGDANKIAEQLAKRATELETKVENKKPGAQKNSSLGRIKEAISR